MMCRNPSLMRAGFHKGDALWVLMNNLSQSLVNEGRFPHDIDLSSQEFIKLLSQSLVNEGRFPPRDPRGSPGVPWFCRNPSLMRAGFHTPGVPGF